MVNIKNNIDSSIFRISLSTIFEMSIGKIPTILVYDLKSNYTDVKNLLKKKQGEKKNNKEIDDLQ